MEGFIIVAIIISGLIVLFGVLYAIDRPKNQLTTTRNKLVTPSNSKPEIQYDLSNFELEFHPIKGYYYILEKSKGYLGREWDDDGETTGNYTHDSTIQEWSYFFSLKESAIYCIKQYLETTQLIGVTKEKL